VEFSYNRAANLPCKALFWRPGIATAASRWVVVVVVVVVGKYPRYPTNDGKNPRDDDMNV